MSDSVGVHAPTTTREPSVARVDDYTYTKTTKDSLYGGDKLGDSAGSELPDSETATRLSRVTSTTVHEDAIVGHHAEVKELDGEVVTFPDGGWRAWLIVIGAMHILFATFGFVNAWGVFQNYYKEHMFPDKTTSDIAWIGSLQYLLIYLPSAPMGRLVDESKFKWPFWTASLLYPVSIFLTAQVKTYWQAILAHGILFGTAAGILFCPAIAIVTHWFYYRRALALGVVAIASSLGGTIFPILVSNCLKTLGFPWTMRICGFVLLYCCTFASFVLRTRLPPKAAPGGMFNWPAFKIPSYACFVFAGFLIQAGLYTPLSYIDVMATRERLGSYSTYLVAIANAFSMVGRIGPAFFADKTGALNILIPGLIGSAITTFAWPFAHTKASLTVVAAINGVFQGCFVSLLAPASAALGNIEDAGRRFGVLSTVGAFGSLLSAPVSGVLLEKTDFHGVSYYAGSMILGGALFFVLARYFHLGGWSGRL